MKYAKMVGFGSCPHYCGRIVAVVGKTDPEMWAFLNVRPLNREEASFNVPPV